MGAAGEAGEAGEHMKDFAKMAEQFKNFMPEGIDMSKFPNFNLGGDGDGADAGASAGANTGKKQTSLILKQSMTIFLNC